jgi:uncharacterized damage-inducible protein DinB
VLVNDGLAEVFRYNRWANLRLVDACRSLSDEQLDARVPGTSGTVRELLLHVVGGQQTLVLRTKGRQHEGRELTRSSEWPGLDVLREVAERSSDELVAIAAGLDEDSEVLLPYRGRTCAYPKRFFLAHAAEHGVEHRTEIKLALAQLGVPTPDLDGWEFSDAAGHGREVTPAP